MAQERLNHVMLLHTHKDHTDNINLLEIAKEFVSLNDRYDLIFWSFLMFNYITQPNIRSTSPPPPPNLNFIPTPLVVSNCPV